MISLVLYLYSLICSFVCLFVFLNNAIIIILIILPCTSSSVTCGKKRDKTAPALADPAAKELGRRTDTIRPIRSC
jgi:hypothetical protein